MAVKQVASRPFADQRPGAEGLRRPLHVFRQVNYLENFLQAVFDTCPGYRDGVLVAGGDGRHFGDEALQTLLRLAAANGVRRVLLGCAGLLSMPAASHLVRHHGAAGALVLTAGNDPGHPQGDFGIACLVADGGPAPARLCEQIGARTRELHGYRILDTDDIELDAPGALQLDTLQVDRIDPVADYAALMERLFDFQRIRDLVHGRRFRLRFDAMHAVNGPAARAILEQRLGAARGSVVRADPRPDFGGAHPGATLTQAQVLVDELAVPGGPDLGAATDAGGERHLILGRGMVVAPGDSLAVLAANAARVPGYAGGLAGVARTMSGSSAVDRVAASLDVACHETPADWRACADLLEAGRATLCGDGDFGAGSTHLRQRDGLWAILFWLNLLAVTGDSVADLVRRHWAQFGRTFSTRHDYQNLEIDAAVGLYASLRGRLSKLHGARFHQREVAAADEFRYRDPATGARGEGEGIRLRLWDGARIIYRLSGTESEGATLSVYLESHEPDPARHGLDTQRALVELIALADDVAGIRRHTKRVAPSVIT